jgi:hypothetical protein
MTSRCPARMRQEVGADREQLQNRLDEGTRPRTQGMVERYRQAAPANRKMNMPPIRATTACGAVAIMLAVASAEPAVAQRGHRARRKSELVDGRISAHREGVVVDSRALGIASRRASARGFACA